MRLPRDAAKKIYETVRKGTPVYIVQNDGDKPVKYVPPKPKPAPAASPSAGAQPAETVAKPEVRAPQETVLPALQATPTPGTTTGS